MSTKHTPNTSLPGDSPSTSPSLRAAGYDEALKAVQARAALAPVRNIKSLEQSPDRLKTMTLEAAGLYLDLSRSPVDQADLSALQALAQAAGLADAREAMFAGDVINFTEKRKVWHVMLRADAPLCDRRNSASEPTEAARKAFDEVQATLAKMRRFCAEVHARRHFTDVVHIGIGGSYLGPELAVQALSANRSNDGPDLPRIHFVANVDPHAWNRLQHSLDPRKTLVILASKSWTTQETALNAKAVRQWFSEKGLSATQAAAQWVAVTARPDLAMADGLTEKQIFPFADWVGGRFSLWSAIGLPIMLGAGIAAFDGLLAGARAMDQHFRDAPAERNAPVLLALLSLWHQMHLGSQSEAVIPYAQRLARLPAFLQQLQMESNGKRVDGEGNPLQLPSAPVVWGEPGTDSQHSFFQALHHSPQIQAIDFILVREHETGDRAYALQANALAQIEALSLGQSSTDPHRHYPGNRPCLVTLLPDLSPQSLGALLAMYEHKTAAMGWILRINSFDQFGVELGKVIAKAFEPLLRGESEAKGEALSPATRLLIDRLKSG